MMIDIPSKNPKVKFRRRSDLTGNGDLCCNKPPLLDIELNHIVPDELHLMLRIMDVLIEAIICTVTTYDIQEHHKTRKSGTIEILNGPMLQKLLTAINDCGVQFHTWKNQESKALKWTSLQGSDKLKLLKNVPDKLHYCHPRGMALEVQDLWKVCIAINN